MEKKCCNKNCRNQSGEEKMKTYDLVKMNYSVCPPAHKHLLTLAEAQHDIDVLFSDGYPEKPEDLTAERYLTVWNTLCTNETREEKITYFVSYLFIHAPERYDFSYTEQDCAAFLDSMRKAGEYVPEDITPVEFMTIWNKLTQEFFDSL